MDVSANHRRAFDSCKRFLWKAVGEALTGCPSPLDGAPDPSNLHQGLLTFYFIKKKKKKSRSIVIYFGKKAKTLLRKRLLIGMNSPKTSDRKRYFNMIVPEFKVQDIFKMKVLRYLYLLAAVWLASVKD